MTHVSVIIATYNRAESLAATLAALRRQMPWGGPLEIVIADNGSTDGTAQVVEAAARRGEPVRYLYVGRPGKSYALNEAVNIARGDFFVMTDDDVVPLPGWIDTLVRAVDDTRSDFGVGRILPQWEVPPPAWMSPALHGVLAVPDNGTVRRILRRREHYGIMPIGANMAVRRSVVARLGGWRTDLGKLRGTLRNAEDHEFFLRMLYAGCTGVYEPSATVRHRVPAERLNPGYFRRWLWSNGRIVAGLERQFPSTHCYWLGSPRYLWGRAMRQAHELARATLAHDAATRFAREAQLRWFAGYLWECWFGPTRARHPTIPRVIHENQVTS